MGLYSLSGGGHGISQYRPAAFYAGAMSMVGIVFISAIRMTHTRHLFAKV